MVGDDVINAGSDSPDSYEAAVLDFLDREMAAIQPSENKTDQSDELDALVSDLLKQVITESDQPAGTQTPAFDEAENLLSEFPPAEEEVLCAGSKVLEPPIEVQAALIPHPIPLIAPEADGSKIHQPTESLAATTASPDAQPVILTGPIKETAESTQFRPSAPLLFASPSMSKSRVPQIAIASVCLLVCIGLAAYYFLGSQKGDPSISKPASTSQLPAAVPAVSKPSTAATPISQTTPRYPEAAIRTRTAATIVIDVQIDNQGKVIKATPLSGPPLFHSEAINAAMKWRYQPATVNGVNVPSHDRVMMSFKP
jgi:TonB family protein